MDMIFIAGFVAAATIFGAFAITTDPKRHPILRNMFFLATIATLFLVVNVSVQTAKTGDWVVNSTTLNATTNTTTYNYIQKAPSVNPADLDNVFLILSAVMLIVFGYTIIQFLLNALDMISRALGWRQTEDDEP